MLQWLISAWHLCRDPTPSETRSPLNTISSTTLTRTCMNRILQWKRQSHSSCWHKQQGKFKRWMAVSRRVSLLMIDHELFQGDYGFVNCWSTQPQMTSPYLQSPEPLCAFRTLALCRINVIEINFTRLELGCCYNLFLQSKFMSSRIQFPLQLHKLEYKEW